ncbi:MAG: SHD1 domain-containing protein [Planctomycetota bacterium]
MGRNLLFVLVATLLAGLSTAASARTWRDNQGNQVEAKFVRVHQGNVILNRGGRMLRVPLSDLIAEDRKYVEDRLAGRPVDRSEPSKTEPSSGTDGPSPRLRKSSSGEGNPADSEPMRTWTDIRGNKLVARFVNVIGNNIVLIKGSRKKASYPFHGFSQTDQNYVRMIMTARGEGHRVPQSGGGGGYEGGDGGYDEDNEDEGYDESGYGGYPGYEEDEDDDSGEEDYGYPAGYDEEEDEDSPYDESGYGGYSGYEEDEDNEDDEYEGYEESDYEEDDDEPAGMPGGYSGYEERRRRMSRGYGGYSGYEEDDDDQDSSGGYSGYEEEDSGDDESSGGFGGFGGFGGGSAGFEMPGSSQYQTDMKQCLECKGVVPGNMGAGDTCPHCGVKWDVEQTQDGGYVNESGQRVSRFWRRGGIAGGIIAAIAAIVGLLLRGTGSGSIAPGGPKTPPKRASFFQ